MGLTEEERRRTMPDRGNEDTVFADGSPTQFSISETEDNRAVAVLEDDILSHIDVTSWNDTKKTQAKTAAKTALLAFKDGVVVNGVRYKVNKHSRDEYTRSNDTERTYRKRKDAFADKMRMAAQVDDMIIATTEWAQDGGLSHPRTDHFVDFVHGDVLIQAGRNQYEAETVVGITDAGEYVFYDVVDLVPTEFKIKEELPTAAVSTDAVSAIQESSSIDSVPDQKPKVNIQNSFSPNTASDSDTDNEATSALRDSITGKAREYMERAERVLMEKVGKALSIPSRTKEGRGFLQEISHALSEEYLREGRVAEEVRDHLFEAAYV